MKRIWLVLFALALALSGCGNTNDTPTSVSSHVPREGASPDAIIVPTMPAATQFVAELSNPWLGYAPGKVFRYRAVTDEGVETIVVEVTTQKKTILGVSTTVVRDRVYLDGELIEDTWDWYAQDRRGNVWYFGEDTKEYEGGAVVSTAGSWEAGVNGARPGIVMLARPARGARYPQEVAPGVAEDMARVVSLDEAVEVPYGEFGGVLQTLEWTPLDRRAREHKYYARGVGLVLETPSGGPENTRVELVSVSD